MIILTSVFVVFNWKNKKRYRNNITRINCIYIYMLKFDLTTPIFCAIIQLSLYILSQQTKIRLAILDGSQQHDQDARYDATSCDAMRHYATWLNATRHDETTQMRQGTRFEKEENVSATVFSKKRFSTFYQCMVGKKNMVWRFLRETGSWLIYSRWIFCDVPACRNDVANYLLCRKVGPI